MLVTAIVALAVLLLPDRWPRTRRVQPRDHQQLFAAMHAEIAAGSSLRHAIGVAGESWPELGAARRLAIAGAPIEDVAAALGSGDRLAAAVAVAARSGGRAAAVFQRLADRAASDAESARQRRVLTVQARLSAAIVAGLPALWLAFGGLRRIASLVAAGAGGVAVAGIVLEALGVGIVWRLARS